MNVIQIGSWVIHAPVLKGAGSKQSHLPGGQVFLTAPRLLPIGAASHLVL